jgi:adenosylmethionine-8-amino-7-oxononanoate aminotransferase
MNLPKRDRDIIWHPFTQEKTAKLPVAIQKAKGAYVYDEDGNSYLDLISSWWVNLHGHGNTKIASSIYKQALELDHIIFAGFTHEPAVTLCEKIQTILPRTLKRFFFSDNGSTSVEIALKMAYQFWFNQGQKERSLFLSFDGGFHGETFGSMSVGIKSGFHTQFSKLLFEVRNIPFPETWDDDKNVEKKENEAFAALDLLLEKEGRNFVAIILEPIVQGASGMRMCRPAFITKVIKRVREYNILVIFDEVMTGFGRTGRTFALEQTNVTPDFLCLSKGITGGVLPLALTITTEKIYNAFLSDDWHHAFAHGHSYTANPISCAAAITSLEILQSQFTQKSIQDINDSHIQGINYLKDVCSHIKNTRITGTIAAFDVVTDKNLNQELKTEFLKQGLLLRPLNNTVYLLPSYITTKDELKTSYKKIASIINSII